MAVYKTFCLFRHLSTEGFEKPRACLIGVYINFSPRSGQQNKAQVGRGSAEPWVIGQTAVKPTEWAAAIT